MHTAQLDIPDDTPALVSIDAKILYNLGYAVAVSKETYGMWKITVPFAGSETRFAYDTSGKFIGAWDPHFILDKVQKKRHELGQKIFDAIVEAAED